MCATQRVRREHQQDAHQAGSVPLRACTRSHGQLGDTHPHPHRVCLTAALVQAVNLTLMLRHNPICVQQLFASSADHGLSEEEVPLKWDAVAVS